MTIVTGLVLFCIVWAVVFFIVNPLWQVSQGEAGEVTPGTPESAPVDAMIKKKALITTVITVVIVIAVYVVIEGGYLTLDDLDFFGPPGWE